MNEDILSFEMEECFQKLTQFYSITCMKVKEYQDDLLISVLDLLLNMPKRIVKESKNLSLFKDTLELALDIGLVDTNLAATAIATFEKWILEEKENIFLVKLLPQSLKIT